MGSLALGIGGGFLGGALAGPIGAQIGFVVGTAAGTYIDQRYIIPALTPDQHLRSLELSDLAPTTSEEGKPMPWLVGNEARVTGTLLWLTDPEIRGGGTGQGKGSTEVATSGARYYLDFAVGWGTTRGAGVDAIAEVRANGEVIAQKENDTDTTSTELAVSTYTTRRWDNPTGAAVVDRAYMVLTSTAGLGPDLSELASGVEVTISGASNAGNNGTFLCARADEDTVSGATFLWLLNPNAVTEAKGASIRVQQTLPDESFDYYDAVTHYTGTPTQDPSSLIEDVENVGNVPGWRGVVYTTFDRFAVNPWGLRLPLLTAAIDVTTGTTVGGAIGEILEAAGYEASEYDASALTDGHRGVAPTGPIEARSLLVPMMLAYNVAAYESGGVMTFRDRSQTTATAISTLSLAAREEGRGDVPRPFGTRRTEPGLLPTEVVVKYREPAKNLEAGSQRAHYPNPERDSVLEVDFPIAMTAQQAVDIAHRILWSYRSNKASRYELTLPPSAIGIEATDVLSFTLDGEDYSLFVTRVEHGANGLIRVQALREVVTSLTFSGEPAEAPPTLEREFYTPPHTRLELLDIAPLRDQDADRWVLYYTASLFDADEQYRKTDLAELHNLGSWNRINTMRAESVVGDVVGTVPDSSGISDAWWDLETTFDVQLYRGDTLASAASDEDVLNGENWAIVGWEVIAFRYATLISAGRYRLSRLLRGRRGTRDWMTRHAENERFVLFRVGLDDERVKHKELGVNYRGRGGQFWSAVPFGGATGDFETLSYTYEGNSRRPFAPSGVRVIRALSSGTYTLYWHPVTRWLDPILPGPVARSSGRFRIRWWDADPRTTGVVLYTRDVNDRPRQVQYEASVDSQTHSLIGISPGDPHWVTVSELDPPYGEGLRSEPLYVDL